MKTSQNAKQDFIHILQEHRERYPLMQLEDCIKLAYQNTFGPEHVAPNPERFAAALRGEWAAMPKFIAPPLCQPEPIGNGLCRFHLTGEYNMDLAVPILADLFALTAKNHQGSKADFRDKLALLQTLDFPDISDPSPVTERLTDYQKKGCPPLRHSPIFRENYNPHYRIIQADHAGYFPLLMQLASLAYGTETVLIAIDGRCGSGKTRLSELIAHVLPCNIIHMDDFYLPFSDRDEHWRETAGGNMDFSRLLTEMILPIKNKQEILYRPYLCRDNIFQSTRVMSPRPLNIIEGSYALHPALIQQYDLTIFLTCSPEAQTRRLQEREGEYVSTFESLWIPLEEQHIRQHIQKPHTEFYHADICIDTTYFF